MIYVTHMNWQLLFIIHVLFFAGNTDKLDFPKQNQMPTPNQGQISFVQLQNVRQQDNGCQGGIITITNIRHIAHNAKR